MVYFSLHSLSLNFLQKLIFWLFSPKIHQNIFQNIHALIVEFKIDQFMLKKCQKKRYESDYDTFNEFFSEIWIYLVQQYKMYRFSWSKMLACDRPLDKEKKREEEKKKTVKIS